MKPSRIVVFAAVALCALQTFAAHTEVTKVPRLPFMRGIGFDGYYGGRDRSYFKQADLFTKLVSQGFDHVRLPVDFRDYSTFDASTGVATLSEKNPAGFTNFGWTSGVGFSTFDSLITNAINAGLYITLDFHGWFDLDPSDATQSSQFLALWKAVAERYKDYPNQLIFEIANEPQNKNWWGICNLQKNAIKEIRKTNPTRLILFDQVDGSQPWTFEQGWPKIPANDNNLAVVVHCYNPSDFTLQGAWGSNNQTTPVRLTDSHRSTLRWDLKQCLNWLEETGVPIVLNEFGVSHKTGMTDHGDITEFYSIITRWCEEHKVPWAPWSYYGNEALDVTDGKGNIFDFVKDGLFPDLKLTSEFSASDYAHKIDITFSGYAGSTALANFPVLVKLSEDAIRGFKYADIVRADGYDLCFTDSGGNLIPHEIDTWNPSGVSTVWVKVPSLTASTKIVAHYGCSKPIVHKVESVWDDNYVGVWHMGEQKLPLADSSNRSRDVTSADGAGIGYGAAGVIGGSVDFGAADSSRCVNMDDHKELDGFQKMTVEAWTKQDAHATNAGILSKRVGKGNQISYYMFDNGSGTVMKYSDSGSSAVESGITIQPVLGQWNHQAYTLDATKTSSNSKGYLNGALKGTGSVSLSGNRIYAGSGELHVGNLHSGNAANIPGSVDEVRISKCVRSADWIQASYDTVAKSSFATYAVQGVTEQNPTLYVEVVTGEEALDPADVKSWTTKIVKDGDGTVVASPVSSTSVTNLKVRDGTVKLSSSAPASVVSKIGEHDFAFGTKLDLSGKSYSVATLKGQPTVQNAATFTVAGTWTMKDDAPMAVAGSLAFGSGATVVLDESLFASAGREGVTIATATGGITGMPAIASLDFALKLSADGKSLIVYDNIPDVADWTTFSKAVSVTFGGVQNGVTLTNFPVLVKLSTAIDGFSYADFKRPVGEDLRFSDSAGNLLPHEIDTWNENGVSTAWVKVPTLDSKTAITAKYGCANPPAVNAKDVWDADYLGVWHLGAASGVSAQPDSTANGKDFGIHTNNSNGVASGADGIVGRSAETGIRTDGKGCFFQSDADKLFVNKSAFTVETWTWQDDHEPVHDGDLRYVLAHSGGNEKSYDWRIYENNKGKLVMQFYSLGSLGESDAKIFADDGATRPARAQWNHTAFAWDGSSGQVGLYLGGTQLALAEAVASKDWTGTMNGEKTGFNLGNHRYDNTKSFKGRIDEVRISKVARSAAWIKATYETVMKPDFATYSTPSGTLSGYGAWMNSKELSGKPDSIAAKGIPNCIRYAFDIDPAKGPSEIGEPIMQVVRDADGNPAVAVRDLAEGRSDVVFSVLASPDLSDWSKATLVPMENTSKDGLWKPVSSKKSGYVYPSQMFFKYSVEIQQ